MRKRWLLAACLANAVCAPPAPCAAQAGVGALGPAPRSADGRFANPEGEREGAGLTVTLPFFLRRIAARWSEVSGLPPVLPNDGSAFRDPAVATNPTVTWIGHSTLLVRMDRLSFLTDPIWSNTAGPTQWAGARRRVPPGLPLEALPPIDFVLISHNHYDHLDVETVRRLARRDPRTLFVVPLGNAATLREAGAAQVVELDWGGSVEVGSARVVCLPARHWSRRGLGDENRALWSGWAVLGSERRFIFAGAAGS